jgi:hypothetical protein
MSGRGDKFNILFRNGSHPLADVPSRLSKEEFVFEMRRLLTPEGFFPPQPHHQDVQQSSMLSEEDAEDLFEVLLLMQRTQTGSLGADLLEMGRQLDAVVDTFFALHRFRQLMERGATSLEAFFEYLDLDKNQYIECCELRHFLKNADSDGLGDWDAPLADVRRELQKIADILFAALDANKDAKVELWEMRKQLSLVAPPQLSLVDIVSHFELKNGHGRGALIDTMDREQLYEQLNTVEKLDLSPEDVVRYFRAVAGGGGPATALVR